jgi:hypothetical protein
VNQEIQNLKDNTLLKQGNPFDLDVIKAERERIDNRLKERGFYYFHPDNLIVQADSTVSKNQIFFVVQCFSLYIHSRQIYLNSLSSIFKNEIPIFNII